ncbi:MAG: PKD domain-containing protein [Saprospiraceae bacterium]|nr:PKD domain-containing protein [Saprospiraceae bacterium]
MRILTILLAFVLAPLFLIAQNANDAKQSVIIQTEIQNNPPQITLKWAEDLQNSGYSIYRKGKNNISWASAIGNAMNFETTWVDTNVAVGEGYEYRIVKNLAGYGGGSSNGYIYAGIEVPATHYRGACLIVIDSTFKTSLASEISTLKQDIQMDGWRVQTLYVDRNDPVTTVKDNIKTWANGETADNKALFILGHVPVPYSGFIAPDGHVPDHQGAWPCDGYYGELDGVWTDQTINTEVPNDPRNDNIPGDGKFDQSTFPTKVELQVGRVDFANMPAFAQSEEELLRRYLKKDHAWRTGMVVAQERGLVQNNFGGFAEGFGQNGWKNFAPMFGYENVKELPYRATMLDESYLWSYGCGAGSYTSASGITTTANLATDSLKSIFTMVFGSYFGDWDKTNNLLRATIASGATLTNAWAARPNWMVHHMALGEHIGFASQISMNNNGAMYQSGYSPMSIHISLMGDPTLRMHILRPITNLTATPSGLDVDLAWDTVAGASGYYVYKKKANELDYFLLTPEAITDNTYKDECSGQGATDYMVRAAELRTSASGTYTNLSQGAQIRIDIDQSGLTAVAAFVAVPYFDEVSLDNASSNATSYEWDLGDGTTSDEESLTHFYSLPGTYTVCLNAFDACYSNLNCQPVTVISSLPQVEAIIEDADCFGTATGSITLNLTGGASGLTFSWDNAPDTDPILEDIPAGDYACTIQSETGKTAVFGPYTVGQPAELLVAAGSTPADPGQSNGSVVATVTGGCQPYTFEWSNGITDPGPTNLPAGEYCVTVTDCKGCIAETCVTIDETSSVHDLPGLIQANLYPNPAHGRAHLEMTFDRSQQIRLDLTDLFGRLITTQSMEGSSIQASWDLDLLPTSRYWVRISSLEGVGVIPLEKVD